MSKHQIKTVFAELDQGRLMGRIQDSLEGVVDEVSNRQGEKAKGSITIKIDIARENEELVSVTPSIKTTMPPKKGAGSLYFFGDGGTTHSRSPYQTDVEDVVDFKSRKGE